MRWNTGSLRSIFFLFAVCAVLLALPAQTLLAESGNYSNHSLRGAYVAQSTGTAFFPPGHPLSASNGPYAVTGKMVSDGYGNISGFSVQIRNGMLVPLQFTGTYEVEEDGTFSVTVTGENPLGQQLSVEYYGVLFDEGKQAKMTAVGISIPGVPLPPELPPNFVGMTETGSLIRQ